MIKKGFTNTKGMYKEKKKKRKMNLFGAQIHITNFFAQIPCR